MSLCTIYYVLSEKMRDGRRGLVMSLCTMYYVFSEKMRDCRRGLVMSLCTRQGLVMSLCTRQETVGEAFAPLGPPLLPWENRMNGDRQTHTWTDFATTRKNRPKGRFFENVAGAVLQRALLIIT